jgi:two-component system cell cycle response regulator
MSRILAMDDNPANLELMNYLLTAFGHDVRAYESAPAALEAALSEDFDLILTDVRMPGMNGFEFVQRYKAQAPAPAPVIAVTALAMVGDRERMLEAGFDGYISKPIDPLSFKAEVDELLSRKLQERPVILAVDDIAVNLEVIDHTLSPFGYRIVRALSVKDAVVKLRGQVPALILCDVHMPDGDGYELIEYVKQEERLRHVPFFVMSSTAWQTAEKQRALALGAEKFILRPIEPQKLVNEVRAAIGR